MSRQAWILASILESLSIDDYAWCLSHGEKQSAVDAWEPAEPEGANKFGSPSAPKVFDLALDPKVLLA